MWLPPDVEAAAIGDWVRIAIVADDGDGAMSHEFLVPLRVLCRPRTGRNIGFQVEAKDLELHHVGR